MDFDVAALLLRLALGPMLFLHGWNKVFGPGGIAGTASWFASLGLEPARVHARVAATAELGAGALLTLGLLTPGAAAAFIGLMVVATLTDHRGKGYFVFKGGAEYTILVGMVATAIAVMGPGEWSIDAVLGIEDLAGWGWGLAALMLGTIGASGLLVTCYRPAPRVADDVAV